MESNTYRHLAQIENINWYHLARCQHIKDLILKYIKKDAKENISILDVGCGTGGTTNFLTQFGEVDGLEPSALAIELFQKKYPAIPLYKGGVNEINQLILKNDYDLVTVLGVLYHENIENPLRSLKEINSKIKNNGWIIWHEAAYPSLTRELDKACSGARRFLPGEMLSMLKEAGFKPVFQTHITSYGFPIALFLAKLERFNKDKSNTHAPVDLKTPNKYLNKILYTIARLELKFAMYIFPLPLGVSYMVIAQKSGH